MGKNDFLSPKGIANASKAKGLQKLRFYCQVCAKQCRDQNGFKCHITSEAHLRQMELFGQNQSRFIDGYSEEFLKEFLQLMSISHRNSRVAANVVYNEFIANKQHTHMNSTRWTSLTEFVKYLGREGIAAVDETPKGWFLTYVPEDREEKMRQQSQKRKQRAQEDASARDARLIEEQIARASKDRADRGAAADAEATALRRDFSVDALPTEPLGFALGGATDKNRHKRKRVVAPNALNAFGEDDDDATKTRKNAVGEGGESATVTSKKESAVAAIARAGMAALAKKNLPNDETIPWLLENLVVKIMSKALRDAGLYKKKARVVKTLDGGFVGECALLDEGLQSTAARVDQAELQTVLPAVGGRVAVVKGAMRGKRGTLMALETESFRAVVDVDGETRKFEYDDVCKVVAADA